MQTRFSEDVIPLSDLKVNPGKVVKQTNETHRPVLLTSRGRGVAVVQSLNEYETAEEERAFLRAVTQGLMDVREGRTLSLANARKKLGLV
jgi:prevent-host-death family protein